MTKEQLIEYSNKYKQGQAKLSIIILLFLALLGISFIGVGVYLIILNYDIITTVVGVIMIVCGIFNIPAGFKFRKINDARIDKMDNLEAARRYCKIYGIR